MNFNFSLNPFCQICLPLYPSSKSIIAITIQEQKLYPSAIQERLGHGDSS